MKTMMRLLAVVLTLMLGLALAGCEAEKDPPKARAKPAATQPKTDRIDINRASADELMTLKGIGEARSKAIIKNRPYARKDELVQKKIIPQSVYDEISDQIIAKQK